MRQQIEALLAQDETADTFLNRPVVELAAACRSAVSHQTVLTGRSVGQYEVLEHLGSGGMGEVYRARDTKLNRDVALKVLPAAFALDPDRLARFTREAQILASLNHPNIAAIYGLAQSEGVHALVLELVAGPTLADRIALGPISIDEALPMARQLAQALEAAHEHGVVHRDLKPANVKLRPDGMVKVLDFGLAKALEPAADVTTSPSNSPPVTVAGLILGTPAYMSPEQTRGRSADKRSDVWAFGCVLFELLTGERAFAGEDASDTLAAVLRGEPKWNALPTTVPPAIRALIEGCLEKDCKERIADLSTARFLLKERRDRDATVAEPMAARRATVRRLIAFGSCVVVAAIAGVAGWYLRPTPSTPIARFTIATAAPLPSPSPYRDIDISPDGAHIAYNTGTNPASGDLWVRAIDRPDAVRLQGLDVPKSPFFSADGQWIGFFSGKGLQKVSIKGGSPTSLGAVQGIPRGATWNSRNSIVFATSDLSTGLMTVSADGGTPVVLTKPNAVNGEIDHVFPSFLPSGDAVLFTVTAKSGIDNAQMAVLDLKTGNRRTLIRGGSDARYIDTGHLLYASAGALYAVRFNPSA